MLHLIHHLMFDLALVLELFTGFTHGNVALTLQIGNERPLADERPQEC